MCTSVLSQRFDFALLSMYASTVALDLTQEMLLCLEAWVLNDPPASTLCNVGCSEWHSCTGTQRVIQLAKSCLCGTQAVLFLHNPFDADFTVVRVGINTVIVQHRKVVEEPVAC